MPRNWEPGMGRPKTGEKGKESKYARQSGGSVGTPVSIPADLGPELSAVVNAVLTAGDAIMFARTAGGGILAITVYSTGCEPVKFYAKDEAQAADVLAEIENSASGTNAP